QACQPSRRHQVLLKREQYWCAQVLPRWRRTKSIHISLLEKESSTSVWPTSASPALNQHQFRSHCPDVESGLHQIHSHCPPRLETPTKFIHIALLPRTCRALSKCVPDSLICPFIRQSKASFAANLNSW